ncbi:hypothetical protein H1230_30455 [Paenibacillus sp. 19GGS1-52]|uniref:hypothetical protein n=1 Tax=Paenibacillus sp. 19GGS1-52 TaxID=2758563 RepID=UPI001EFB0E92|nr:hypothetical protein [Paenibacillus sp. 19GGS1-52]ULO07201.1 hypothetical protein H1230_30455 [Paenibacillus sp. 19GGS1-52]
MNKMNDYDIPSVRLTAGLYALSKLACAGLTFLLISLLLLGFPQSGGIPKGWPISLPYAIYAYGLPTALVADALLRILRSTSQILALFIYAAAGFGAGFWLVAEQGGNSILWGIGGIAGLLLFRIAQLVVERYTLLLPIFALFVPLLCLLLL